jgi:hypothetical protein
MCLLGLNYRQRLEGAGGSWRQRMEGGWREDESWRGDGGRLE